MAVGDSGYQGGGASVLTNFYNNLRQDEYRRQQLGAQENANKAKRREETAKALEGLTAKLSFKGVRDKDIPSLVKDFEDIKNLKAMANSSEDRVKSAEYLSQMQERVANFEIKADRSISEKGYQKTYNEARVKAPWMQTEEQVKRFEQRINTSTFDLNSWDENDWNTKGDPNKALNTIRTTIKGVVDSQKAALQRIRTTSGNQSGVDVFQIKSLGKEEGTNLIFKTLTNDPETGYSLRNQFPTLKDEEIAIKLYEELVPESVFTDEDYKAFDPDYREPKGSGSGDSQRLKDATYRQQLINRVANNDPTSLREMEAYLPKGSTVEFGQSVAGKGVKGGYKFARLNIPDQSYMTGKDSFQQVKGFKGDISLSKGDFLNEFNDILNTHTYEKIKPSELNIQQGKKTGKLYDVKANPKGSTSTKPKTTTAKPKFN